jgi:RHH-type proline utilization regulon transcriptional repressor/proline dehydrogenase/delta 1-pyrroline-5-carboxylate dehydrogenase
LVAGNVVIAKPAEQTPLIAFKACQLLHEAGVPTNALQYLPGDGATLGSVLLNDPKVAGVAFTGSNETAALISKTLANRSGPLASFIAETGGLNVMIVDSSALPEQVVNDSVISAFGSAGQRCSALRVLCVQEDIADRVIELLTGVMKELRVGDPAQIETDIGPVIDEEALATLEAHAKRMTDTSTVHYRVTLPPETQAGVYCAPMLVEIKKLSELKREVFGPILHVLRYKATELDSLLNAVNETGYGLTLGIHSRVEATISWITQQVRVGNVYVNRNMIGAVVGVQPFGGMGLSGTGPKAGGPHYLTRFTTEQTVTVNTVAVGGNASLLTITEDE